MIKPDSYVIQEQGHRWTQGEQYKKKRKKEFCCGGELVLSAQHCHTNKYANPGQNKSTFLFVECFFEGIVWNKSIHFIFVNV